MISGNRAMSVIDAQLVARMRRKLDRHSLPELLAEYQISANTWSKLRRGEPVRLSLAERLVRKIANDDASDPLVHAKETQHEI